MSSSVSHMEAARLAISDFGAELEVELDTLFIGEAYSTAGPALRASERLVAVPGMVAVIGHSNSGASLAASPVYNQHEIVQLAPTSTAAAYSEAGPYSFRIVPPDTRQGPFLADVLRARYPADARVALSYVNDDYGRGLRRAVVDALESGGPAPQIVLDLPHVDNLWMTRDSAVYLEDAIVASDPDVIVWLGRPSSLGPLRPGLARRLARTVPILGGDALATAPQEPSWKEGGAAVHHAGVVDLTASEAARRWAERYERTVGYAPTADAALAYDATAVVLSAIAAGARTGPEVRRYLRDLGRTLPPYSGITGPIAFDEHGDVQRTYRLMEVPLEDPR